MNVKLCIIIPSKNEEAQIPLTVNVLADLFDCLVHSNTISQDSRICFVDDGSDDSTWSIIEDASRKNEYVTGIKLPHNYGQSDAIAIGLHESVNFFDCFITMDCDLQDDVNVITSMIQYYIDGFNVVSGVRNNRDNDSFFKRFTAHVFYYFLRIKHSGIIFDSGEFRLYDKAIVKQMLDVWHDDYVFRVLFTKFSNRSAVVYYKRLSRVAGMTKYNLSNMIRLAYNAFRMPRVEYVRSDFDWPSTERTC